MINQVQGRFFDSIYGFWQFDFREEYSKEFIDMICLCYNEDGKIVERIYIMPKSEIIMRASVSIVKYRRKKGLGWYEHYRVTDEEVEKVNDNRPYLHDLYNPFNNKFQIGNRWIYQE